MLLEVLLACGILALAAGWLWVGQQAYRNMYYRQQLQTAGRGVVTQIRNLQQDAMLHNGGGRDIMQVLSQKPDGYVIGPPVIGGPKRRISFADWGCDSVYFSYYLAKLSFSTNGSPAAAGYYILKHRKAAQLEYKLAVQPVTGRVVVYE